MFQSLQAQPTDPILGLMAAFRADANPRKIDLGVGVYRDGDGNTPVMKAVKEAENRLLATQQSKAYVGPAGATGFNDAIARLTLGADLAGKLGDRRLTMQVPGGCGGLRLAANFIKEANPAATVWVSDPTWANHAPLLGSAGLSIASYPYYDRASHSVSFERMMAALAACGANDVLLLHGCCHNPCGADLDAGQWQAIRDLALARGCLVMIDLAYQGLGDGLADDVAGVRLLAEALPELILVSSCSKNFGLYRERTGALSILCENPAAARLAATALAAGARAMYSMPPDHGAAIVETILADAALRELWETELANMRDRINGLRARLAEALGNAGMERDFSFIKREKGMFSFLGLEVEQVRRLVADYAIYLVDSSRINVAGISNANIDYLVSSIAAVAR